MKVTIKKFDVKMELKNNGIELDVRKPSGHRLGDLVITKSKLIWCEGKTTPPNGVSKTWAAFIDWMES
ncbi:MAG: hypothetical protein IIB22_05880 [Chloroflexi bacterium]|nr:hypothetical protein [Chloroflexota bacterium]